MTLRWTRLQNPAWTVDLERVMAGVSPEAIPAVESWRGSDVLPGTWWVVTDCQGQIIAAAVLDTVWGDGHVQVFVSPDARRTGAGAFAMARLRDEAQARGLAWLRGEVPNGPSRAAVIAWLGRCGFAPGCSEGEFHLPVRRRRVAA